MLRNTPQRWGSIARAFHWGTALLVFLQFALGWIAVSLPLSPTKLDVFVWHKSVGLTVLAVVVLRVLWRWVNPTPALPAALPLWERAAARVSHTLLYLCLIVMPLSGWVINSAANVPFKIFWWVPLPAIAAPDEALAETAKGVHLGLFIALALLVAVHVAAAFRHHWAYGNDVLTRMLPFVR